MSLLLVREPGRKNKCQNGLVNIQVFFTVPSPLEEGETRELLNNNVIKEVNCGF